MNIGNSEAKIGAVHELGCRLDDNLENATKDLYRAEGAAAALKQAVSSLEGLAKIVAKDLDEALDTGSMNLEDAKKIRDYIDRGRLMIQGLSNNADTNKTIQSGKVQAFQQAINVTKKFKDEEMGKLKMLADAIAAGSIKRTEEGFVHTGEGARPAGIRPGMSVKERRLAEISATTVTEQTRDPEEKEQKQKEDVDIIKNDLPVEKQKRKKVKKT